ncbi:MAG: hypothetical protein S4CHLAM7_04800 [Chlamydiae bacterium]|nr:hypothetical protein [Chlamydiota bacterium]
MIRIFLVVITFFSHGFMLFSASLTEKLQENRSLFEVNQDWIKEYQMGLSLAKKGEIDLAQDAFKRALILIPQGNDKSETEIQYALLFTHYLKQDSKKVIQEFEKSRLLYADQSFSFHHDLMLLLYDCYEKEHHEIKSNYILAQIQDKYPEQAQELILKQALMRKDMEQLKLISSHKPALNYLLELSENYMSKLKSPRFAKWLGLICPGAGYLYVGQGKTALTSFFINGLLIAASTQLFLTQFYTLGVLAVTFELGWYIGGALGGKEAAKIYNEQVYQDFQSKVIMQENLLMRDKFEYEF